MLVSNLNHILTSLSLGIASRYFILLNLKPISLSSSVKPFKLFHGIKLHMLSVCPSNKFTGSVVVVVLEVFSGQVVNTHKSGCLVSL